MTINFPLEKVKESVKKVSEKLVGKYNMIEVNEVFNTYQFALHNGMIIGIGDLVLEAVSDDKTKISFVVNNAHGSQGTSPILEGMANDYLNVLGKILAGQDIEKEKNAASSAGLGGIVYLIVFIIIIVIIVRAFF